MNPADQPANNRSQTPQQPPPVPPRPMDYGNTNNYSTLSPYQSMYSNTTPMGMYSNPGYSAVNPYSTYGQTYGAGYGMSPYGNTGINAGGDSAFIRLAEEQSRGALSSVENVVHTFTSISNMLEQTLNAFYSSFRAILAVADQFSRLKSQLSSMIATLGVVRLILWVYRRILVLLRLKPANYHAELQAQSAWQTASSSSNGAFLADSQSSMFNWSSLSFMALTFGGPWLLYRLIQKIVTQPNQVHATEKRQWATGDAVHYEAKVLYDFVGAQPSELAVTQGELIRIAPKDQQPAVRGWMLGSTNDGQRIGLVPINYVKILSKKTAKTTNPPANFPGQPNQNLSPEQIFEQNF